MYALRSSLRDEHFSAGEELEKVSPPPGNFSFIFQHYFLCNPLHVFGHLYRECEMNQRLPPNPHGRQVWKGFRGPTNSRQTSPGSASAHAAVHRRARPRQQHQQPPPPPHPLTGGWAGARGGRHGPRDGPGRAPCGGTPPPRRAWERKGIKSEQRFHRGQKKKTSYMPWEGLKLVYLCGGSSMFLPWP